MKLLFIGSLNGASPSNAVVAFRKSGRVYLYMPSFRVHFTFATYSVLNAKPYRVRPIVDALRKDNEMTPQDIVRSLDSNRRALNIARFWEKVMPLVADPSQQSESYQFTNAF